MSETCARCGGALGRNGRFCSRACQLAWTPDRVESVAARYLGGETAANIAKSLLVTRNSVIGAMHRNGYEKRQRMSKVEPPQMSRSTFPKPGRCVWPSGHPGEPGFSFCGARVIGVGRPYCAEHTRKSRL